jgi:hypothetical protein
MMMLAVGQYVRSFDLMQLAELLLHNEEMIWTLFPMAILDRGLFRMMHLPKICGCLPTEMPRSGHSRRNTSVQKTVRSLSQISSATKSGLATALLTLSGSGDFSLADVVI